MPPKANVTENIPTTKPPFSSYITKVSGDKEIEEVLDVKQLYGSEDILESSRPASSWQKDLKSSEVSGSQEVSSIVPVSRKPSGKKKQKQEINTRPLSTDLTECAIKNYTEQPNLNKQKVQEIVNEINPKIQDLLNMGIERGKLSEQLLSEKRIKKLTEQVNSAEAETKNLQQYQVSQIHASHQPISQKLCFHKVPVIGRTFLSPTTDFVWKHKSFIGGGLVGVFGSKYAKRSSGKSEKSESTKVGTKKSGIKKSGTKKTWSPPTSNIKNNLNSSPVEDVTSKDGTPKYLVSEKNEQENKYQDPVATREMKPISENLIPEKSVSIGVTPEPSKYEDPAATREIKPISENLIPENSVSIAVSPEPSKIDPSTHIGKSGGFFMYGYFIGLFLFGGTWVFLQRLFYKVKQVEKHQQQLKREFEENQKQIERKLKNLDSKNTSEL